MNCFDSSPSKRTWSAPVAGLVALGVVLMTLLPSCVPQECPPAETIVIHDTVTVMPEPARFEDIVGHYDPTTSTVYAKEGHADKVLELLHATKIGDKGYKIVVYYPDGEMSSAGVSLKIVNTPAEFMRPAPGPGRRPVPGTIYVNAECMKQRGAYTTPCTLSADKERYFRSRVQALGTCMEGKGYCYTLDSVVSAVWEYYQDSECNVLLDAVPKYPATPQCIPPSTP
jgi:hypothetical protein